MSGISPTSGATNQEAAHDTGLYDPDRHDNHIVALYDTDDQARAAHDILTRSGIPASALQMISKGAGTLGEVDENPGGIWGAIRAMFVMDADRNDYTHAVGRGHAVLLVVPTPDMDRQKVIRLLEETSPVDFDARLEEWRQAGYDTSAPHADYAQQRADATNDPARHQPPETNPARRENGTGAVRVRSYVTDRPTTAQPGFDAGTATAQGFDAGNAKQQTAATAGAQTSGANARP